jgi:hypothetical protein
VPSVFPFSSPVFPAPQTLFMPTPAAVAPAPLFSAGSAGLAPVGGAFNPNTSGATFTPYTAGYFFPNPYTAGLNTTPPGTNTLGAGTIMGVPGGIIRGGNTVRGTTSGGRRVTR